MNDEVTDHVPGLSRGRVEDLVDEAEAGYDLDHDSLETNPHLLAVPDDLLAAITARAQQDGESPEDVVRRALAVYLDIA